MPVASDQPPDVLVRELAALERSEMVQDSYDRMALRENVELIGEIA